MPWFPDFASAVEFARSQTRAAGQLDPVGQYFAALNEGDPKALETVWPGEVVVFDPRAGEIRGHRQLRRFVSQNQSWLAGLHASIETIASTKAGGRAVVELLAHLDGDGQEGKDGQDAQLSWPVAVVAESPDDLSVVFRSYCSQVPVDGRHHLRSPILPPGPAAPGDIIGRYQAALAAGDTKAILATFGPEGYYREPIGPHYRHSGTAELRPFFERCLRTGGIELQPCAVTDDGVRCAVEYNCVAWGTRDLPPQAGLAVYERGSDGLLAAVRVYDDIENPAGPNGTA